MLGLNRFYSNNKGTAKKIIKVVTIVSCWRCNLRNSDASVFYVMTLAQLGKDTDLRSTLICEDSEERSGWASGIPFVVPLASGGRAGVRRGRVAEL